MGLNDYSEDEGGSGGPTRTTYYKFENPNHPESKEFEDPEKAQLQFEAAQYIQNQLGTDRHNLVGEFLVAVQDLHRNGEEESLQELVTRLRE